MPKKTLHSPVYTKKFDHLTHQGLRFQNRSVHNIRRRYAIK